MTVAYVASPSEGAASARDVVLAEERDASEFDPIDRIAVAGFDFDISKIRDRREVLFPFLTLDLLFLERVNKEVHSARQRLANPFAPRQRSASTNPPLTLGDVELQQVVDRAWSRRDRWRTFSGIAALVTAHDADEGRLPELLRAYLDQNVLQPFCDTSTKDPRFWAMLENMADHADFIDFVRSFAREHPSSKTTTELLFLLDELSQGSRDALIMLMSTDPAQELQHTFFANRDGYMLANSLRAYYGKWLAERQLDSANGIKLRYDALRLRLLSTIVETTPGGYRAGDARFLMGEIQFNQHAVPEALRSWRGIVPDPTDSYVAAYSQVLEEMQSPRGANPKRLQQILRSVDGHWRVFSIGRLRQFGHVCDTF
jgi:hypothetical protein